ncbi:MAG: hypothetical protein IPP71_07810 [Bacteroidetes bacterium]|nr:hypothetical protein [Bacteroidota bacterium]
MASTQHILEKIIQHFHLNEQGDVLYSNQLSEEGQAISISNPSQEISDIIYRDFYTKGIGEDTSEKILPAAIDTDLFYNSLCAAYSPDPGMDKGWKVIQYEQDGSVYVTKSSLILQKRPGQYVLEYEQTGDGQKLSEFVSLLVPPIVNTRGNYFYYIHGSQPLQSNPPLLIRFYFNLLPAGAPILIQQLTSRLNQFKVPFSFKCCTRPVDYVRSDVAVLYVNHDYFAIVIMLLNSIVPFIAQHLNEKVPLFALPVYKGISFAENPSLHMSFGQSRCNLISQGLVEAVGKKLNEDQWVAYILESITQNKFDIKRMHLNPGSKYPYNFSLIEN